MTINMLIDWITDQNYEGYIKEKLIVMVKNQPSGALIVKVLLHVPAKNPKYDTEIWLKAFNGIIQVRILTSSQIQQNLNENSFRSRI